MIPEMIDRGAAIGFPKRPIKRLKFFQNLHKYHNLNKGMAAFKCSVILTAKREING